MTITYKFDGISLLEDFLYLYFSEQLGFNWVLLELCNDELTMEFNEFNNLLLELCNDELIPVIPTV